MLQHFVFVFISDFPSSLGGPSSSKKSKDKSNISRSQSQRPVQDKDHAPPRITAASFKETRDEAAGKADTRPDQHSLTDPKMQLKPTDELDVKTTQNVTSEPEGVCEDVSPSGGPSATLQPETCKEQEITQAAADLNPEKMSSPPPSHESDHTESHEDDGLESGLVKTKTVETVEDNSEHTEVTKGPDGNQNSDSINR